MADIKELEKVITSYEQTILPVVIAVVLKSLSSGKLVWNLKMYGIIVAAHKPDESRLLQVNIDFEEQTCVIRRVTRTYKFAWLLNISRSIGREG